MIMKLKAKIKKMRSADYADFRRLREKQRANAKKTNAGCSEAEIPRVAGNAGCSVAKVPRVAGD